MGTSEKVWEATFIAEFVHISRDIGTFSRFKPDSCENSSYKTGDGETCNKVPKASAIDLYLREFILHPRLPPEDCKIRGGFFPEQSEFQ